MKALEGIRVLDLTRALAGPFCTLMLGDHGADVIKIEIPGSGDDTRTWGPPFIGEESAYFLSINRNKRSLTLNFKEEKAREIFLNLAKDADVVVENFTLASFFAPSPGSVRLDPTATAQPTTR